MLALLCALLMILLFSEITQAADTAAVAAALPDEASECRYLLVLCNEVRISAKVRERHSGELKEKLKGHDMAKRKATAAEKKAAAARSTRGPGIRVYRDKQGVLFIKPSSPDPKTTKSVQAAIAATRNSNTARYVASEALRKYEAANLQYKTGTQNTMEAAKVIRVKHEKTPACFQECSDILSMENYK